MAVVTDAGAWLTFYPAGEGRHGGATGAHRRLHCYSTALPFKRARIPDMHCA